MLYPNHFGSIAGFALVALVFFYAYGLFIVIGAEIAAIRAGYQPNTLDLTGMLEHAAKASWPVRRAHLTRFRRRAHASAEGPIALPAPASGMAENAAPDDSPTDPRLSVAQQ